MVPRQRFRQWRLAGCCVLVILAALLLVATGVLLGRSVFDRYWPAGNEAGLLQELTASLLSLLPPEGWAGIAALVAAGSLWAAFRAAASRWSAMADDDFAAAGFVVAERSGHLPPVTPSSGPPPEQLQALAGQARMLADSLAASVANAARAVTAGRQADVAAGQGTALLTQMQAGLGESLEQMQQANGRLLRLAAYGRQAEELLASLQERGVPAHPQRAAATGADAQPPISLWDTFRQDFKQLAILAKTMDGDARDSQGLLEKSLQEVRAAAQLARQSTQAVAEIGQAAVTLAEEAGLLHQVAQAQAESCGECAATCASLAGLPGRSGLPPAGCSPGGGVPHRQFVPT